MITWNPYRLYQWPKDSFELYTIVVDHLILETRSHIMEWYRFDQVQWHFSLIKRIIGDEIWYARRYREVFHMVSQIRLGQAHTSFLQVALKPWVQRE